MKYGALPKQLPGQHQVDTNEMFFYQDMPIKLQGVMDRFYEDRLYCFNKLIAEICWDFVKDFGINAYRDSYTYISAKRLFVNPGRPYNRPGYHTDGYMTDDVNYIWYDRDPTVFNTSEFSLSPDHNESMKQMEAQAYAENDHTFPTHSILRLNQYNVHKVGEVLTTGIRTFLKISFSGDKFDLQGNTHNHLLNYNWEMKPRSVDRNVPQSQISEKPLV